MLFMTKYFRWNSVLEFLKPCWVKLEKKKNIISKLSWKLLEIILGQIVLVFQENHQEDLLLWEYKQSSSLEMDETFIQL